MTNSNISKKTFNDSPIYADDLLIIASSTDRAVPGMYTIKLVQHKESMTELTDIELKLLAFMIRQIRIGLRTQCSLEVCGMFVEEQPRQPLISYSIPFHIDKMTTQYSIDVYQPYFEEYLKSYSISSSGDEINTFNQKMRDLFSNLNIRQEIEKIKKGIYAIKSKNISKEISEITTPKEDIIEVYDLDELPVLPEGKRYFTCIGGAKNFQCFIGDSGMSKGEFLHTHENLLDECLKPVYSNDVLIVRQDTKYAIPGFYIISPKSHYRSIDEMPLDIFEECMFMARKIRLGLLKLDVNQTHLYHDEKYKHPASAHFWVLPIYEDYTNIQKLNPTIYSKDIWTYLDSFPRYKETGSKILEFNKKMRDYLN